MFALIETLRPQQWTKNLVIFAGLIFSRNLLDLEKLTTTVLAFLLFCALSGSVYLINDITDLEKDRLHPDKSRRPIPSGRLNVRVALVAAILIGLFGLAMSFRLDREFGYIAVGYVFLMTIYSLVLKNIVILDVLVIASGFVLRALAGAAVIDVKMSSWLFVCAVLLPLFLALGKRRGELALLEGGAAQHRRSLSQYSTRLLDQLIAVAAASTILAYCLYTISEETVERFGTENLKLTIPFVLYGLFRYLYLLHQKGAGSNPDRLLLTDRPLIAAIFLWILMTVFILYTAG